MRRRLRVLLVEDSEADIEFTVEAFELNFPDIKLVVCETAEAALDSLESNRAPHLILLDLNLPGLSGLELLAILKASDRYQGIPVVILTTSNHDRDLSEGWRLGAAGYIV